MEEKTIVDKINKSEILSEEDKLNWIDLLPIMNEDQIERLTTILND